MPPLAERHVLATERRLRAANVDGAEPLRAFLNFKRDGLALFKLIESNAIEIL